MGDARHRGNALAMAVALVQVLALAWTRWFVLLLVQPLLRVGVGMRWWSVAAVLAGVLAVGDATRLAAVLPIFTPSQLVTALVAEVLVGALLGVCLSLGAHAVLGAGSVAAVLLRIPTGPWLALVASLMLVASLELGLHHAALHSGAAVQQSLAIGDARGWAVALGSLEHGVPTWLAGMTVLALALATPALLVAAAVELAGAAIARGPGVAPGLAQAATTTARLAAVLVALGASWAIDLQRWAEPALPAAAAGVERLATTP